MSLQKYTGKWPNWVDFTAEIIAENARRAAWPKGTARSKYTYNDKDKFKNSKQYGIYYENLEKAFPTRKGKWGHQTACGASCDVFASTSVVSTGYDKNVPRGLGGSGKGQYKHFAESSLWEEVNAYKKANRKPGYYILTLNKGAGGHACISGGSSVTYEAGYITGRYGCTVKAKDYNKSSYRICKIYKPTKALRKYIKEGDRGETVKRIQLFLNWAGFYVGNADGECGSKTIASIKAFQKAAKLTVDGEFGESSVKAAQSWTIDAVRPPFDGKLPTKTLKNGSTGTQVEYLQDFLDWYDDNELIRDGEFGKDTENAVKKFQKSEGLDADGVFGPESLKIARLYLTDADVAKATNDNDIDQKKSYGGEYPSFDRFTSDIFIMKGKEFCWPLGTAASKRNYKTGSRMPAFTTALYEAFPKYKGSKEGYKQGASCSVFIATIVRNTGLDKKYLPSKTLEHMKKNPSLWQKQTQKTIQAGDIVFYWKNEADNDYHILMYGGKQSNGKYLWYQANANKQYPYMFYGSAPTASKYKHAYIYRPIKAVRNYMQIGDVGNEIVKLQAFLNWYGGYKLDKDGEFGKKTQKAVMNYQNKEGLAIDGVWGAKSLAAAKKVVL